MTNQVTDRDLAQSAAGSPGFRKPHSRLQVGTLTLNQRGPDGKRSPLSGEPPAVRERPVGLPALTRHHQRLTKAQRSLTKADLSLTKATSSLTSSDDKHWNLRWPGGLSGAMRNCGSLRAALSEWARGEPCAVVSAIPSHPPTLLNSGCLAPAGSVD